MNTKQTKALSVENTLKMALEAIEACLSAGTEAEDRDASDKLCDARAAIRKVLAQSRSDVEQPAIKQALTPEQPAQRCKYGNEPVSCTSSPMDCQCAIDALFEQPAQQQEPEGVVIEGYEDRIIHWRNGFMPSVGTKLYTSPPNVPTARANANAGKPWVGLTDDEIDELDRQSYGFHRPVAWRGPFARAIEAKLKEKNDF